MRFKNAIRHYATKTIPERKELSVSGVFLLSFIVLSFYFIILLLSII